MRIAINAIRTSRQGGGGTDHYIVHLVNALAAQGLEFDLFTLTPQHFSSVPAARIHSPIFSGGRREAGEAGRAAGQKKERRGPSLGSFIGDPLKMGWTQTIFPAYLTFRKYDLLFSPSQIDALPFSPIKQVITVLDIIPFIMPDLKAKHDFFLQHFLPLALRQAAHIIAISENTKKDVVEHFGIDPRKISAIPLGIPEHSSRRWPTDTQIDAVKNKYQVVSYILCVSSNHRHKNIPGLLRAFALMKDKIPEMLVIAGYQDPGEQRSLERLVQEKKLGARVRFLGHVDSEDMPALYAGAQSFVFPSLYEGFGLPPLEALRYGLPVAVSRSSSLPEVVGEAGVYFDPNKPEDIAEKVVGLIQDRKLRRELARKGPEQASRFSWQTAAQSTIEVFKRIAG